MNIILYFLLLIGELVFLIGLSAYAVGLLYSSIMGAPYVPTSKKQVKAILEKAGIVKGQTFVELGSGDGRIVRQAVKQFGVKGIGVEINQLLVFLSRFYAGREKLKDIEFRRENIFSTDLSKADAVYLFLMPQLLRKLTPQMAKNMRKNSIVISHGFKLEGWEKRMTGEIKSEPFSTFFYRV